MIANKIDDKVHSIQTVRLAWLSLRYTVRDLSKTKISRKWDNQTGLQSIAGYSQPFKKRSSLPIKKENLSVNSVLYG